MLLTNTIKIFGRLYVENCMTYGPYEVLLHNVVWAPGVDIGFGDWTRESGIGPGPWAGPGPRPGFQR